MSQTDASHSGWGMGARVAAAVLGGYAISSAWVVLCGAMSQARVEAVVGGMQSSWLWYAENASSGAYGIPQSLPADKMAAFGANYRDDAAVQIDWGLWYIAQAYGSPSKAWQHSEQVGWY